MFVDTLPKATQRSLALLGAERVTRQFYLAGGSALALHLGHRVSVDLDFFSSRSFDSSDLVRKLKTAGTFLQDQKKKDTLLGTLNGVKISFFRYSYPMIGKKKTALGTAIASIEDIGAMKLEAIGTRGKKRDFIDLYFICQSGHPLEEIIEWYERKFRGIDVNMVHYVKALTYFVEAEADPMPRMLKRTSWSQVKGFFDKQAPRVMKALG